MIATLLPKLQSHLPANIYSQLPGIVQFGIDGPKRLSNLLGQVRAETDFIHFTENMNYSAQRLRQVFPRYFPTDAIAAQYANQPERIGNRVYADRLGNRNEASGDGYRMRGRGGLQTTGTDNYRVLGTFLGVDLIAHPELVATDYILASAAFFFMNNHLWTICDRGVDDATVTEVTHRVNGGESNLAHRIQYTQEFYTILTT